MSLYHKHRPQSLDEVIGNENAVEAVRAELDKDDPSHSYMFHGPTGCGKTTLARIVANTLGATGRDFQEVDTADFRGIETIREMRRNSMFQPVEGFCRVWLLDECHKLSNEAQNALLKALEDPPAKTYYILCTTEPQKLLSTIKGRCFQCQVAPLNEKQCLKLLRKTAKAEGESLGKQVYEAVFEASGGLPRNALQILDQVITADPDKRLEIAQRGSGAQGEVIELCQALMQGAGWKKVSRILKGLREAGEEPESVRRAVLGYCSNALLNGENNQAAAVMEEFADNLYDNGFPGLVLACYSVVKGE